MAVPTTRINEKGNIHFEGGLAWFGHVQEGTDVLSGSLQVSPFLGWGDDVLPNTIKWNPVSTDEMLKRYNDRKFRITGKRPQKEGKRIQSKYFTPRVRIKKAKIFQHSKTSKKWVVQFTMFGHPSTIKYGLIENEKKAQAFMDECMVRQAELYSKLQVLRKHRDPLFKEYIITGDKDVLTQLLDEYGKV